MTFISHGAGADTAWVLSFLRTRMIDKPHGARAGKRHNVYPWFDTGIHDATDKYENR